MLESKNSPLSSFGVVKESRLSRLLVERVIFSVEKLVSKEVTSGLGQAESV